MTNQNSKGLHVADAWRKARENTCLWPTIATSDWMKSGAIFLGQSCSVVTTTAREGLLCTCKPRIDSRVSVPCLLWLLLTLAVCFPRLLLFSRASLESAWPLRRCTIVMTPLKAASHLPFHKIPVIAKSIFSREQDSSMFGESSWKLRSESWGKIWTRIFYQFLVLAIVKVEK